MVHPHVGDDFYLPIVVAQDLLQLFVVIGYGKDLSILQDRKCDPSRIVESIQGMENTQWSDIFHQPKWYFPQNMQGNSTFCFPLLHQVVGFWGCWASEAYKMFFFFPIDCWRFFDCVDYTEFTLEVFSGDGVNLEVILEELGFPTIVNWLGFPSNWPTSVVDWVISFNRN